jgi:hypothetical protein
MITNTAPFDYRKRRIIIPRLERLCEVCGAHVIPMPPDGAKVCSSCKHPDGEGDREGIRAGKPDARHRGSDGTEGDFVTRVKICELLKKMADLPAAPYPSHLLRMRRRKFVAQINQKADHAATRPAGS